MSPSCKLHSSRPDVPSDSDHSNREDAFSRVSAFVIADNIADFSADVFNQIKLIIDDYSDSGSDNESDNKSDNKSHNGAHGFTFASEDGENDPFDAGGDEEASNGTSAMAVRLSSPGTDSIAFESDEEMEADTNDENLQGDTQTGHPITIEDEVDMDNRFHFSTPAALNEGDEDMADSTPVQEDMGNESLFSPGPGSDKGDQDMADIIFIDEDMVDDDLSYQNFGDLPLFGISLGDQHMGNDPLFSSPTLFDQGDQYMADDTPTAALAGLEEEDEGIDAANFGGGNQVDGSSSALHNMQSIEDHEEEDDAQEVQDTPSTKDKSPQKGPRGKINHRNNHLYSGVMEDEENPTWPPKFYLCKLEGCGFQGAWNAKQVHFEIKHPKEWKEATGCEAKVYQCPVEDCDYKTVRSNYIARHLKSVHPGSEEAREALSKKGKKSKK